MELRFLAVNIMNENDEELTDEEKKVLERDRVIAWLMGQKNAKRNLDKEAYIRAREKREHEEWEEETEEEKTTD